ncbi:M23 family metallopeptidase [Paenibacillus ferrarius]|uniref:M23 family metallopeptidase n=1 Tax=Paenibacillus ferrarius TaxID=1469647 RepID=UPI003D280062
MKNKMAAKLALAGIGVLTAATVVVIGLSPWDKATSVPSPAVATPAPTPPPREAVAFHMQDWDRGWVKYADGMVQTKDGGATWTEVPPSEAALVEAGGAGVAPAAGAQGAEVAPAAIPALLSLETGAEPASLTLPQPTTALLRGTELPVKQAQFLTPQIGWAMPPSVKPEDRPLLVTVDGGASWSDAMTEDVKAAILGAKTHLLQLQTEAGVYASEADAKAVMSAGWKLIPDKAAPGDAVLVRHKEPGTVTWQGKTYTLQPYGAGYFTYLPIGMSAKPGTYPIGDQTLTVVAKKFETQYLQVTQEMESMKQDTARINADQKLIDAARSKSEPTFLFEGPFVKPIEGILTTPYGYTRYVNGKFDSSHMALDLAAKQGTPIKATNDGIVVLADLLYLTGNSIYIDHGMGLFSQYAHLSELRVKAGDHVKQGDIIGLVGTTGFSTGPHLHFTFWAHNVQVNPDLFFNTTPFRWMKVGK